MAKNTKTKDSRASDSKKVVPVKKKAASPAKKTAPVPQKAVTAQKSSKIEPKASLKQAAKEPAKSELKSAKGDLKSSAKATSAKGAAPQKASAPPPRPIRRPTAPPPEPPKQKTFEERQRLIEERLAKLDQAFVSNVREHVDLSWIYHDSALEGTVYTPEELRTAVDPNAVNVDSSMQPVCEEIRRHLQALNYVRELAKNPKLPITVDLVRDIYAILHPEEGDGKAVKYRKDIPQHRLYFHEYAAPDKIPGKLRQVIDWVNDPETTKQRTPLRYATRAHYDLLRVFPFTHDSGKVARLFLNLLLLKNGLPPAIIHSTERQRYYEALKGSSTAMNVIVQEAIDNQLASFERLLEQAAQRVPVHTP